MWEALAVLLSIALLVAIIVILTQFDHQPQPQWKYVSLNTVVSWLSTLSKGCVIYAINEALGQLKWVWFAENARPMPNLRTFDNASRGFYGSAELIWTLRAKHFAVWGSLAVILALAFDPFAQNLIHYYTNLVNDPSQTALVANTTNYTAYGPAYDNGAFIYVHSAMKANVYNSLFNNDPLKPWSIPQYTCSSGNCTWAPIAALEVQANCSNVTDHLQYSCSRIPDHSSSFAKQDNCSVTLPSSNLSTSFIRGFQYGTPIAIGTAVREDFEIVYKNSTLPAIQIIAANSFGISGEPFSLGANKWQARECIIEPIVRSSNATVKNGTYSDTTLAIWRDKWRSGDRDIVDIEPGFYFEPPWGPELGMPHNQSFFLSAISVDSMTSFFQDLFSGFTTLLSTSGIRFVPNQKYFYAGTDFIQTISVENITGCAATMTAEKLDCAMNNVAASITKTFRDSEYVNANLELSQAHMARGQAMTNATYISVHWQWIVLPALVWLLGAVTLIGAIWKTRRANVPKWKNDPMPLLFLFGHGGQTFGDRSLVGSP
ncbi:hypothetical protein BDV26DRAFT_302412 [Aspergillus bertholletiae]|uniref:Uncharacterized protein n=1 Tax=Aspergillus bertholletiae TaxID=1226010 RepID=A0A5N7BGL7_9EURO|nr:hypothetical protein BDV26DRAFT_302412 [Aspergillus bertholletiae]